MLSINLTKGGDGYVLDQVGAEVMEVITETGQKFDGSITDLLAKAMFGVMHNNQKMYHDNKVMVLGHLRRVNYGE